MELSIATAALGALAHEHRLQTFRLLVRAGTSGQPAGRIADELGIPNNTLSTHLAALTRAGLLTSTRDGRQIIYRVDFDGARALLRFLLEDCCQADARASTSALKSALANCC